MQADTSLQGLCKLTSYICRQSTCTVHVGSKKVMSVQLACLPQHHHDPKRNAASTCSLSGSYNSGHTSLTPRKDPYPLIAHALTSW